jgi:hypothetical protein
VVAVAVMELTRVLWAGAGLIQKMFAVQEMLNTHVMVRVIPPMFATIQAINQLATIKELICWI